VSTEYQALHAAVARLLPVAADGSRRPAERDASRTYWEVGRLLNEHLTGRATYGQRAIARLAADLNLAPRTLYRARKVQQRLSVAHAALPGLTWSHCRLLVTIDDDDARRRLTTRAAAAGWSVRKLQEQLNDTPAAVPPSLPRVGTYRIVTIETATEQVLGFDLGFGVRRPLVLPGKPGKKTRRLLRELAPGDAVERTIDAKGRPALRRVWGKLESRLYVHNVTSLRPVAVATLHVSLDLGFDVIQECRMRLRSPAKHLSRSVLEKVVPATSLPVVARSVRLPRQQGYAVDLFQPTDPDDPASPAQHLNALWVLPAGS